MVVMLKNQKKRLKIKPKERVMLIKDKDIIVEETPVVKSTDTILGITPPDKRFVKL